VQDDDHLLARMLSGDEEAFTILYRQRQGPVYRFALCWSRAHALILAPARTRISWPISSAASPRPACSSRPPITR